jgi:RND family efflux transporter MFP subunit
MKKHQLLLLVAGLSVVTAGVIGASAYVFLRPTPPSFRLISPETRNVQETVRASGLVTAGQSVDLSFVRGGRIKTLDAHVGDTVHAGQLLAELDNSLEGAQISQARAALAQRAAGSTPSQIAIFQAAVDAANADLQKTKTDTTAGIATAQSAVDAAQNNMKMASGDSQSQIVLQAYQNANTAIQSTLSTANNALLQADNILGVDTAANSSFAPVLSLLDSSKLSSAKVQYTTTKSAYANLQLAVSAADPTDQASTDGLITRSKDVLSQINSLLSSVTGVLNATVGGSVYLPQANLAAMEANIQLTQTGVQAQNAALVATEQGISNAKNALASYTIALAKAQQDLANAQQSAVSTVNIKQAMYTQAVANLTNAKAPVRDVDLGPLQAALNMAAVAYSQTRLIAPIDGVITAKNADIGSIASPNVPVLTLINQASLQAEILVSEADVSKVHVGDHATMTLDAYGPDTAFDATIVKIDPTQSTQNNTTGYRLTLQFSKPDDRIKAGMTANASITVNKKDNALTLPERSIMQKDGKDIVFLMKDGATQPVEQEAIIGVKGDDGYWEITSGLSANDQVVNFGN